MARRRKTPPAAAPERDRYGMTESRQQFEPGIREEAIASWIQMLRREEEAAANEPCRQRRMTRAFLLLREEPPEMQPVEESKAVITFESLITAQSVGPLIIEHIFASGGSALRLALTSKRMWTILGASVDYFDFFAGRLQNLGPSGVFVTTAPEFTLGEMMATRLTDPYGFGSASVLSLATPFTDWHNAAHTREEDVIATLYMVRMRMDGLPAPPQFLERILEPRILEAIRTIKDPKKIFKANQFTSLPSQQIFEPQMIYSATRLQLLLVELFNHRKKTRVLHFHNTPFFDRRILAIVLRASPHVTMLGVYNCPLIHFGDLIPILDLISEINNERRMGNVPLITAFDFYPSFHRGLATSAGQRSTYGLTADSLDRDIVQRGLYAILLKGFLKARHMKLDMLFKPGNALRAFLLRLPNPPLSIPTFFDGLRRYLEREASLVKKRHALFDLTKPIRLGLERNLENESWYQQEMGTYLLFCSSCGYEMLYEFFPAGDRGLDPYRRVCAGCSLQDLLDQQPHDMRDWKVGMLAQLMPEWNGMDFNKDAPSGGQEDAEGGLMWLRETATSQNEPSPLYVNAAGELTAKPYVRRAARNNKRPADSLQSLPSLQALVKDAAFDRRWADLFNHCNWADLFARARRRVHAESAHMGKGKNASLPRDSYGEVWHRERHARELQSFNHTTAVHFHLALEAKGW
ncbi:hypothetical protein CCM_05414 [Cordyceps militaris CM01]|uniref:Uncharacterized protein n=1 Tax=Cordyceps militaris (strain CM01) TaxID=983644 RepID=G3JJL6_CORMM|nr:uncharacterized protein CCM_05414 [Cordyceps militaris CM01]EGX91256.1 hypothetical protein CCM_05414 [Cordyceps militaris CM01]